MEKTNSPQLELFSQQQSDYAESKQSGLNFSFFNYMRGYEKTILLIIAFIIIGIISFSLGVEKGKRLTVNKSVDTVTIRQQITSTGTQKIPVVKEAAAPKTQQPVVKETTVLGVYTIQIASYQVKESARKEAELLKKRGLNPIIISKGKYSVLCVGSFPNKESANSFLSEIEKDKRYRGCIIRRM